MDITSKSYTTLEFDKVKEELSKFAKFKQSKTLCLCAAAYNEPEKIQHQINLTREAKKILDFAKDTPTEFIAEIQKIKNNLAVTYLSEEELNDNNLLLLFHPFCNKNLHILYRLQICWHILNLWLQEVQ